MSVGEAQLFRMHRGGPGSCQMIFAALARPLSIRGALFHTIALFRDVMQ